MPEKCQHRRFTGKPEGRGYVLVCKVCGLVTLTEYTDLTEAVLHRSVDFKDAAAERLARSRRQREVRNA